MVEPGCLPPEEQRTDNSSYTKPSVHTSFWLQCRTHGASALDNQSFTVKQNLDVSCTMSNPCLTVVAGQTSTIHHIESALIVINNKANVLNFSKEKCHLVPMNYQTFKRNNSFSFDSKHFKGVCVNISERIARKIHNSCVFVHTRLKYYFKIDLMQHKALRTAIGENKYIGLVIGTDEMNILCLATESNVRQAIVLAIYTYATMKKTEDSESFTDAKQKLVEFVSKIVKAGIYFQYESAIGGAASKTFSRTLSQQRSMDNSQHRNQHKFTQTLALLHTVVKMDCKATTLEGNKKTFEKAENIKLNKISVPEEVWEGLCRKLISVHDDLKFPEFDNYIDTLKKEGLERGRGRQWTGVEHSLQSWIFKARKKIEKEIVDSELVITYPYVYKVMCSSMKKQHYMQALNENETQTELMQWLPKHILCIYGTPLEVPLLRLIFSDYINTLHGENGKVILLNYKENLFRNREKSEVESMEHKLLQIYIKSLKETSSFCILPTSMHNIHESYKKRTLCFDFEKDNDDEVFILYLLHGVFQSIGKIQEAIYFDKRNTFSRYMYLHLPLCDVKTESLYYQGIVLKHVFSSLIEDYDHWHEEFLITLPNQNRAIDQTFIPVPIKLECLDSFIRSDIIKSTKMNSCILALAKVLEVDLDFFGEMVTYRGMVEFYNESVVTTLGNKATLLRLCSNYFFETNLQKLCACFQVCTSVLVQALLQLVTSDKKLPQENHNQIEAIVQNTYTENVYLSKIYSLFTLMTYTVNKGSIFTANEEPKQINTCSVTLESIVKDLKCYSTDFSVKAETEGKSNQDIDLSHNEIKKFLYNIINYNWQPRQNEISVYPASTPLDMSNELIRVGSLANFPDNNHPSLIRIAQAGFYSEGKGRELKCYSCGQKYDQWLCNSNPLEIHQQISPNCDVLKTLHPPSSQSMNFFMRQNSQPSLAEVDSSYQVANNHVGSSSTNDSQPRTEPPQTHFYEADCRNPSSADSTSFSILTSSSGRPVNIMSNSNPSSVSYDSGLPSSVGKSGFERPQHGSSLTSQSNSGAGNGYASNSSASSSGYGSGSQGFASSNSSGSSGFRSADSGFSSGSSTSGAAKPPNLPTHTQLPTLDEIPQENVQSNIPKEKYPEYKEVAKRRESYKTWPEKLQFLHPLDLAECGFFYSKFGDCVRCFHCGIGLRNWETDDNPWVEHARWSRKCYYLRQKKGQEFIDQVLTILGLQTDSEIEMQAAGITPPQSEPAKSLVKDPIKHPAAQYIITEQIFGEISERTMKKAMNQLLQQHEWEDITNERLIDYLLENREKIESGETKTNHANMSESAEAKSPTSNITEDNAATGSADPEKLQKENEELKDLYTCKICLDEKVGITFVPCGHLVTCRNCSPKIKRCPLCRTFIRGTIKTTI